MQTFPNWILNNQIEFVPVILAANKEAAMKNWLGELGWGVEGGWVRQHDDGKARHFSHSAGSLH
jgi:hypothetical protein